MNNNAHNMQHHTTQTGSHHQHQQAMLHDLGKRFLISVILTIPIMFLSPMIQPMVGMIIHFHGQNIVTLLLSSIIFLYGGKPFLYGMKKELTMRLPGMMTLVGFSIIIAYAYSSAIILGLKGDPFFLELATLIDVMLLGHWLEMHTMRKTAQTVERLASLLPTIAHKKYPDGSIHDVEASELAIGDSVIIRPGEKVSADGIVEEGESEINEAALTGESLPVTKTTGSSIVAGSINGTGALTIKVTKSQEHTFIAHVIALVTQVIESKSHVQDLANRAAFYLTIIALGTGAITFFAWLVAGSLSLAFQNSVSVMISTCPHALGLAIPLVLAVVTSLCAKNGILVQNRLAFEQAKDIQVVVFDKTGTLTTGKFEVTDVIHNDLGDNDTIIAYAAAVEQYAKHTIADAIVAKAQEKKLQLPKATKNKIFPGKGACSTIQGQEFFVGNTRVLDLINFTDNKAKASIDKAQKSLDTLIKQGKTSIFVATKEGIIGIIALTDIVRPEARHTCELLKQMNIRVIMITGDNNITAHSIAQQIGIDAVIADVLPDQKAVEIQKLRSQNLTVAMVGDGINDAPAIAQADVGIAIGSGTDIVIKTADIILIKDDPRSIIDIIKLSQLSRKKMLQNLFWATSYNVIMIPMATGIFAGHGITMLPAVGALFMSLSTIIVALNALLISYKKQA